jgi:hypothetical protein
MIGLTRKTSKFVIYVENETKKDLFSRYEILMLQMAVSLYSLAQFYKTFCLRIERCDQGILTEWEGSVKLTS